MAPEIGAPPPLRELGEFEMGGIADNGAVRAAIAGVPNQLWVEDAVLTTVGERRWPDGDDGPQCPAVRRDREMFEARVGDVLCGRGMAGVDELEGSPVLAADASSVVAPREFGADEYLLGRLHVCPGSAHLFQDAGFPLGRQVRQFGQFEELTALA